MESDPYALEPCPFCGCPHPQWVGSADGDYVECGSCLATMRPHDPDVPDEIARWNTRLASTPTAPTVEAWRSIGELTEADGYVLGWSHRDDRCSEREWFLGRKYDQRHDALLNEWTGKWRMVEFWMPLPAAPTNQQEAGHGR